MTVWWGALALGAPVALGHAAVELAFGDRATAWPDRLLRWASGVAVGFGLLSSGFSALLLAGAPREDAARLAIAGVTLAAGVAERSRRKLRREMGSAPSARVRPAAIALAALAVVIAIAATAEHAISHPEGGWDATMVWNLRARMLFRGAIADAFAPEAFPSHPGYPLMLPGLVALGWTVLGMESAVVPALAGAVPGLLCVVLVAAAVARLRGWNMGLLAAAFLASTPLLVGVASNQYADLPSATFVLVAAVACTLAVAGCGRRPTLLALSGAAAGMAAWTKNEALLFTAGLAAGLLLERGPPLSRRLRDVAALAAGALPSFALLAWFKAGFAPPSELLAGSLSTKLRRAADPPRLGLLGLALARRLVYFQRWGAHLVGAIVALALAMRYGPRRGAIRPAAVALAVALGGFVVAYATTPYEVDWHVVTSADRLIFQCWPAAVFLLAAALPVRGDGDDDGASAAEPAAR